MAFARVVYSVLFGQVVVENAKTFAINSDEWVDTLVRLISAFLTDDLLTT